MSDSNDARIVASWLSNTAPWTEAVRNGEIASRVLVTNQAIVDAVRSRSARTGIDIGCGEGWLVRALDGIAMTGVDVAPALVAAALHASPDGDFRVMSYEDIALGKLQTSYDVAVCNFSLLGKESVDALFAAARSFVNPDGALIVQTLHPCAAMDSGRYEDGWREGSWAGFSAAFTDPPPWYFRTMATWLALFADQGLRIVDVREPLHPASGKPLSLILTGEFA